LNAPDCSRAALRANPERVTLNDATFAIGAATRPITAGDDCGDVAAWWEWGGKLFLCLADGLGHGEYARVAALAAAASARQHQSAALPAILERCDQDLRATRGVAMGLAILDPIARGISFCGVGNIRALLTGRQERRFTCGYGIVGAGFKNLLVETLPFAPGDTLVMASDGILEHFVVSADLLGAARSPRHLADAILEHWAIATDDVAVLACQAQAHAGCARQ
jgi:serine phosphatase RsbU (regulator of sigma subunit)